MIWLLNRLISLAPQGREDQRNKITLLKESIQKPQKPQRYPVMMSDFNVISEYV